MRTMLCTLKVIVTRAHGVPLEKVWTRDVNLSKDEQGISVARTWKNALTGKEFVTSYDCRVWRTDDAKGTLDAESVIPASKYERMAVCLAGSGWTEATA